MNTYFLAALLPYTLCTQGMLRILLDVHFNALLRLLKEEATLV